MQFARFKLIYDENIIKEPIICQVCKKFNVEVNIRTAKVTKDSGILAIEIDGDIEEIEKVVSFLKEKGVDVEPIEGQVFIE